MWWGPVILASVLALPLSTSAASGVLPYQIFWKNPNAPDAMLCGKMVFHPPTAEESSDTSFCRAFRQFQVIEVRGSWARIGSDVWIETADLMNPALLQRSDPRGAQTPRSRLVRGTESR